MTIRKPAREMTRGEIEREMARIPYARRHGARWDALKKAHEAHVRLDDWKRAYEGWTRALPKETER